MRIFFFSRIMKVWAMLMDLNCLTNKRVNIVDQWGVNP